MKGKWKGEKEMKWFVVDGDDDGKIGEYDLFPIYLHRHRRHQLLLRNGVGVAKVTTDDYLRLASQTRKKSLES